MRTTTHAFVNADSLLLKTREVSKPPRHRTTRIHLLVWYDLPMLDGATAELPEMRDAAPYWVADSLMPSLGNRWPSAKCVSGTNQITSAAHRRVVRRSKLYSESIYVRYHIHMNSPACQRSAGWGSITSGASRFVSFPCLLKSSCLLCWASRTASCGSVASPCWSSASSRFQARARPRSKACFARHESC